MKKLILSYLIFFAAFANAQTKLQFEEPVKQRLFVLTDITNETHQEYVHDYGDAARPNTTRIEVIHAQNPNPRRAIITNDEIFGPISNEPRDDVFGTEP